MDTASGGNEGQEHIMIVNELEQMIALDCEFIESFAHTNQREWVERVYEKSGFQRILMLESVHAFTGGRSIKEIQAQI